MTIASRRSVSGGMEAAGINVRMGVRSACSVDATIIYRTVRLWQCQQKVRTNGKNDGSINGRLERKPLSEQPGATELRNEGVSQSRAELRQSNFEWSRVSRLAHPSER
jgi:hypothetical protein